MKKKNDKSKEIIFGVLGVLYKSLKALIVTVLQIIAFLVGLVFIIAGIVKISEVMESIVGAQRMAIGGNYVMIGFIVVVLCCWLIALFLDNYSKQ
jgi:hypothetical protein